MLEGLYIDDLPVEGVETFTMGSPAPRAVSEVRPSAHGATDATRFYGPRVLELTGIIRGADWEALWAALDALKGALVLGTLHVLRFRRQGLGFDERVEVRVDSPVDVPLTTFPSPMLRFGVSLLAPDPRLYADTLSSGAYDPTDAGEGGLDFSLAFSLDFNADDDAGRLTVENQGNIATPPALLITGPVTNPIIDNDTTGESIYVVGAGLAAGDTLAIDVASRNVLLNGSTPRPDLIDVALTRWFELAPGVNQLRLRGSDMSATETELSVSFRSARV